MRGGGGGGSKKGLLCTRLKEELQKGSHGRMVICAPKEVGLMSGVSVSIAISANWVVSDSLMHRAQAMCFRPARSAAKRRPRRPRTPWWASRPRLLRRLPRLASAASPLCRRRGEAALPERRERKRRRRKRRSRKLHLRRRKQMDSRSRPVKLRVGKSQRRETGCQPRKCCNQGLPLRRLLKAPEKSLLQQTGSCTTRL